MLFSSRSYAIGMAHYQMAGGLKSLLLLMVGYVVIVGAILGLIAYNVPPGILPKILLLVATLFLIMEGFGIVVLGAVRIAGCIRMDMTTNMLESHRQMPVSAPRALLGYLLGTTVHIVAVVLLNIILLAILEGTSGIGFEPFILSQIVLAAFALFIWNFSAMGALMFRQAMPLMVLVFMFGGCGSMALRGWGILPGLSLLTAPFLGETVFNLGAGGVGGGVAGAGGRISAAYPVALAAQALFGTLFFIGACRRYRGAYLTTFNVAMGIALVALWGLLSVVAIGLWPDLTNPLAREFDQPALATQIVAALCAAALLLIVPVHALATWETRHAVSPGRRALALAAMTLAGALLLFTAPLNLGLCFITLLVLAAHVATVYAGLRFCAKATPMAAGITMAVLLAGLWLVPILIELIRWFFLPENRNDLVVHDFTLIGTFSPVGVLLVAWDQAPKRPPVWIGILFQLGVAAFAWQLARRRLRKQAAAALPAATVPPPLPAPS